MPVKPDIFDADIAALAARAGRRLTPAQLAEMIEAYRQIEKMAQLVRTPRELDAEPANTFSVKSNQ